jgi:hypothetical protein
MASFHCRVGCLINCISGASCNRPFQVNFCRPQRAETGQKQTFACQFYVLLWIWLDFPLSTINQIILVTAATKNLTFIFMKLYSSRRHSCHNGQLLHLCVYDIALINTHNKNKAQNMNSTLIKSLLTFFLPICHSSPFKKKIQLFRKRVTPTNTAIKAAGAFPDRLAIADRR